MLVESGIWETFLVNSRILSCGIRNIAQRIRMPLTNGIQNPSSTDSDSRIQNPELSGWIILHGATVDIKLKGSSNIESFKKNIRKKDLT